MADDLSDVYAELRRLQERVRVLETANPLEASSITNGRVRFIGGLLRVDSGGRVEIVGTLQIDGTTNITGTTTVTGTFKLEGPWSLKGNGDITGTVTVTGDINVTGSGRIKVGNMVLDPSSNGGSMKFSGGPEVYASGQTLSLYSGALNGGSVDLSPGLAKVSGGGARWFEVNSTGFQMVSMPTKTSASVGGLPAGVVHADAAGNLFRVAA